jgi:hypothetical protein
MKDKHMSATNSAVQVPKSLTIELTDNARKDLALIIQTLGVSVQEALSRAIGMEAFLCEQAVAETEVILKHKNGARQSLPIIDRGDNAGHGRYG